MIQRYLKILSYGIKLSKLYLVLRIFQLILSSASSAFSLLLPKMLLNAIATKNLKTVLIILSLSFFVSTINSLIDRFLSPKLSWLREKINAKIVDNFLQKSINLDLEYFDQPDAYDKYTIALEPLAARVGLDAQSICAGVVGLPLNVAAQLFREPSIFFYRLFRHSFRLDWLSMCCLGFRLSFCWYS